MIPPVAQCVVPECRAHRFSDERQEFPTAGGPEWMNGDALMAKRDSTATWRGATKTRTWCLAARRGRFGLPHLPREEDWPVMPVMWHDLIIRPFHFFAQSPALYLPKGTLNRGSCCSEIGCRSFHSHAAFLRLKGACNCSRRNP